jgi:hypothetical protein
MSVVPYLSLRELLMPIPKEYLIIPKNNQPTTFAHQLAALSIIDHIISHRLLLLPGEDEL